MNTDKPIYIANGQLAMFAGAKAEAPDNHANRGMSLEKALNEMHELYAATGRAQITKQYIPSLPVKDGKWAKVVGKSTVDYEGIIIGGRAVAFDAKDCQSTRIELSRLKDHQLRHLLAVEDLGGIAFVLARFEHRRCYAIPAMAWRYAVEAHKIGQEISLPDMGWTASGKASIAEKECLSDWRMNGYEWLPAVSLINGHMSGFKGRAL